MLFWSFVSPLVGTPGVAHLLGQWNVRRRRERNRGVRKSAALSAGPWNRLYWKKKHKWRLRILNVPRVTMYNFVDNFLILLHNLNVFCAVVMDNVNGSCQLISATAQDWMQRFVRRVSQFQRGLSVPIRVNYAFFPRVLQLSICVGWVVSRQPIVRKGLANCWLVPVSWTSGQMMRFFVGLDGLWGFFLHQWLL